MTEPQNRITHVAFVLDASISMGDQVSNLIRVTDAEIQHLARRSQELDQETRVSIYTFANDVRNVVFDKDVLRLPSIAGLYQTRGNRTALIDAALQSQKDLARTAQMYGEHAFLTYVLTDGENNVNSHRAGDLRDQMRLQPAHWTVACLVPDARGKHEAQSFGFAPDNIAIWNPNAARGVEEAGSVMRAATDRFMEGRTRGVTGTRSLFSTGADAVNAATVQAALAPLAPSKYETLPVGTDAYIQPFVEATGRRYVKGSGYYQLTKTETIQRNKNIVIREKGGAQRVFSGPQARDLLGLGGDDVRVRPDRNPDYDVFVQSSSVNRRLVAGTALLIIT
jgi:hypothetical protein